jgi:RecB family exonuclease
MPEPVCFFLGWDQPFLPSAAGWLVENVLGGDLTAADGTVIVVPGSGAAGRLQSLLLAQSGGGLAMPPIVTPGSFPGAVQRDRLNRADKGLVAVAAATVLRDASDKEVAALLCDRTLLDGDINGWLQLAGEVESVATELAGGGWTGDVSKWPTDAEGVLSASARRRFDAIAIIRARTDACLAEAGLHHNDSIALSLAAGELPLRDDLRRIVLVGVSEAGGLLRSLLDRCIEEGIDCTSLVRGPEDLTEAFDSFGCVDVDWWSDTTIALPDACIIPAGGPGSQAAAILSGLPDGQAIDDVTVVVPDHDAIPIVRRSLEGHGIRTRHGGGTSLEGAASVLLVLAVAKFTRTRSFAAFAALIRHPDLAAVLGADAATIAALDAAQTRHLPSTIGVEWPASTDSSSRGKDHQRLLRNLHSKTMQFVRHAADRETHTLPHWMSVVRELLLTIYGEQELDARGPHAQALSHLFRGIELLKSSPPLIIAAAGDMAFHAAVDVLSKVLEGSSIAEYPDPNAVEVVGWLEALTDDAPTLLVAGMNAESIDRGTRGDAYLPESLRDALGLDTSRTRMARDAHGVTAMHASRAENGTMLWVVGRTSVNGDPLAPSPLLLREADDDVLARRVIRLTEPTTFAADLPPQFGPPSEGDAPPRPSPADYEHEPLSKLRVTAFRDYLACPYRFWLRHVLRLREARDDACEVGYADFGTLVHDTLQRFGGDKDLRELGDERELAEELSHILTGIADERYAAPGQPMLPSVAVQVEQARRRLQHFARDQARQIADGWQIIEAEFSGSADLDVDGTPFKVTGRIDRIDRHADGRYRILDYKTSSKTAEKMHFKKKAEEWIDLQLPLYTLLVGGLIPENADPKLGFFRLSSHSKDAGVNIASWDAEMIQSGQDVARDVIRKIRNGDFDRLAAPAPRFCEDLSWICQDGQISIQEDGER